jgi:hypothetical protein
MKTIVVHALAAIALFSLGAQAQDVYVSGQTGSDSYYAITPLVPATYSAPAVCAPPAGCPVARPCAGRALCAAPVCPTVSPNVTYFGGSYSQCRSYASCANSTVVYFGRGQAWRQGYLFGLPR